MNEHQPQKALSGLESNVYWGLSVNANPPTHPITINRRYLSMIVISIIYKITILYWWSNTQGVMYGHDHPPSEKYRGV